MLSHLKRMHKGSLQVLTHPFGIFLVIGCCRASRNEDIVGLVHGIDVDSLDVMVSDEASHAQVHIAAKLLPVGLQLLCCT